MVNNTRDCLLGGCVVYEEVMKGGGGGNKFSTTKFVSRFV